MTVISEKIKTKFVEDLFNLVKALPGAEDFYVVNDRTGNTVWDDKMHFYIQETAVTILDNFEHGNDNKDNFIKKVEGVV